MLPQLAQPRERARTLKTRSPPVPQLRTPLRNRHELPAKSKMGPYIVLGGGAGPCGEPPSLAPFMIHSMQVPYCCYSTTSIVHSTNHTQSRETTPGHSIAPSGTPSMGHGACSFLPHPRPFASRSTGVSGCIFHSSWYLRGGGLGGREQLGPVRPPVSCPASHVPHTTQFEHRASRLPASGTR